LQNIESLIVMITKLNSETWKTTISTFIDLTFKFNFVPARMQLMWQENFETYKQIPKGKKIKSKLKEK